MPQSIADFAPPLHGSDVEQCAASDRPAPSFLLDLYSTADPIWSLRIAQATWAFFALGIVLRLGRYLLCFPLWGDEAYLVVNFPHRGYLELLKPLDYGQVCPILFLWAELACVQIFGLSEWSLRLFPCVCGLLGLCLFRQVASRVLKGVPLLIAVAIFAVSYYPIRHAAEVKPYASDLLVSLILIYLTMRWLRTPSESRWLWFLAGTIPFALGLSYPAVFVAGGVSLALLTTVWTRRDKRAWIPYLLFNALLVGTFVGLFALITANQYESSVEVAGTAKYWGKRFPPLTNPWELLVWFVSNHTGRFFGYPIGDDNGASSHAFLCFAVGAAVLWRHGDRRLLGLFLAPFGLNLLAAALQRYPYGGSGRIAQHLAPMICLLAGLGAAALLARFRTERARRRGVAIVAGSLALFGSMLLLSDIVHPYKQRYDRQVRDFARCLWIDKAQDAELVCLSEDLHEDFATAALDITGAPKAQYLCYQRIYAPRQRGRQRPQWEAVSATRPLRCVAFRLSDSPRDQIAFCDWLAKMQQKFDWVGYEKHDLPCYYRRWRDSNSVRFEVYEFTPKGESATANLPWKMQLLTPAPRVMGN